MTKGLTRELIGMRIAREFKDGMYVNLGFGLPTLAGAFIPQGVDVMLHAENGFIGYGRIATDESEMDIDFTNASGQPVVLMPGACFFDYATSFCMIRGGHIDITVLGAFQVSEKGDLANWKSPYRKTGSIGGAMDLACGAKKVIVAMEHTTPDGKPRIVKECTFPLTAKGVVNTIVTDLAYIEVTRKGLLLKEVAPGITADEIQAVTEPKLIVSHELVEMEL